jgi:translation initiation factor 2A
VTGILFNQWRHNLHVRIKKLLIIKDRSLAGLQVVNGPPTNDFCHEFEKAANVKVFQYSGDGSLLAWTTGDGVKIVDASNGKAIREIAAKGVADLGWSPKGSFLSSWERYVKPANETDTHKNLKIWNIATGQEVMAFTLKTQQSNWNVKWTDDERYCARMVSGEVQLYDSKDWSKVHSRLKLENVSDFSISPGPNPSIAVFVPEKKGQPASIKLFSISSLNAPIGSKTFFKAEKCTWYWNQLGTGVLVLTQTEVGDNYYGETALYYLATAGNYDCRVALGKFLLKILTLDQKEVDPFMIWPGHRAARNSLSFTERCQPERHYLITELIRCMNFHEIIAILFDLTPKGG